MSRLEIPGPDKGQLVVEELYKDLERRIEEPSDRCYERYCYNGDT